MLDVKHTQVEIDLIEGVFEEIANPLCTSFDLAHVYVQSSSEKLTSSRFYRCWGDDDEAKFKEKLGIWIIPTTQLVMFQISLGGRANFPKRFREMTNADTDDAMFFLLPPDMEGGKSVLLKITLICSN